MTIPKQINFIWLGSMLRNTEHFPHQSRIINWRILNPNHEIKLWFSKTALLTNPEAYQELQEYCINNGIIPSDIDTLPMKKHVCDFIVKCIQHDSPNWAAISDLLRFYILRNGSWYFDTDIILTDSKTNELTRLPDDLRLPFDFALNLIAPVGHSLVNLDIAEFEALKANGHNCEILENVTIDNYTEAEIIARDYYKLYDSLPEYSLIREKMIPPARFYYSPDIIAAASNSQFIIKCIEIIENMLASPQITEIFQQLHNLDPEKRRLASCYTTGEIAFAACLQLKNQALQPFITLDLDCPVEDRLDFPNIDSLQKISVHQIHKELNFLSLNERSYMPLDSSGLSGDASYEDTILKLFYEAISYVKPTQWFNLFNFWSTEPATEDSSVSISAYLKL
ncbi:MAG: hypothetical protein A3E88_04805 [Legionellales bacterium RIFCSPHIGHO2_12_FULL_35_11]|nr:MAG: hypothetical protein A3E88_04805 [Legionellales bacterium RIFCSPHIGHO2_12_FULL_35_11]